MSYESFTFFYNNVLLQKKINAIGIYSNHLSSWLTCTESMWHPRERLIYPSDASQLEWLDVLLELAHSWQLLKSLNSLEAGTMGWNKCWMRTGWFWSLKKASCSSRRTVQIMLCLLQLFGTTLQRFGIFSTGVFTYIITSKGGNPFSYQINDLYIHPSISFHWLAFHSLSKMFRATAQLHNSN